jgi:MOSC domain-containing protein
MIRITGLNIYPVKGCRGIALDSARVAVTGFEHDREWLITRPDGRFMTQREEPRLALIETALIDKPAPADTALRLRIPGGSELQVSPAAPGREVEVTIWKDNCAAFDAGDEAAEFLTGYLGSPVRLVRFDARRKRASSPEWTPGIEALNQFSDGFPWLLASEASLEDLNSRLQAKLPMNRFRPNIVVSGLPPFGEDRLHDLTAGAVRLRRAKGCTRCIVTTTDQATGLRDGKEPLQALAKFRFDRELKGVVFGQNLILIEGAGAQLQVGQELTPAPGAG